MPRKPKPLAPEWAGLMLQEQAKRRSSGVVARVFVGQTGQMIRSEPPSQETRMNRK